MLMILSLPEHSGQRKGKAPDGTPIRVNRGLAERRQQIGVLKKRRSGNAKNSDPARRCWEKGKKR